MVCSSVCEDRGTFFSLFLLRFRLILIFAELYDKSYDRYPDKSSWSMLAVGCRYVAARLRKKAWPSLNVSLIKNKAYE